MRAALLTLAFLVGAVVAPMQVGAADNPATPFGEYKGVSEGGATIRLFVNGRGDGLNIRLRVPYDVDPACFNAYRGEHRNISDSGRFGDGSGINIPISGRFESATRVSGVIEDPYRFCDAPSRDPYVAKLAKVRRTH